MSKPHSNGYLVGVWVREGDGLAPAALPSVFPTVDSLPIAILRNFYKGIKNKPQKQMIDVFDINREMIAAAVRIQGYYYELVQIIRILTTA